MRVKSLQQSAEKYVQNTLRSAPDWIRNSISAFIDGDPHMSLKQITGMIDAYGDVAEAQHMFLALPKHNGDSQRRTELARWFEAQLSIHDVGHSFNSAVLLNCRPDAGIPFAFGHCGMHVVGCFIVLIQC